jgi:hypothetical protein
MKKDWMITFRSVTFAQRGQRALRDQGIYGFLQRTPRALSEKGCGYCLRIRESEPELALELLTESRIPFKSVYWMTNTGEMEEWQP